MIVYRRHFRDERGRFCSALQQWIEARGIRYGHFLLHGIDAQILIDSGDSRAAGVIENAKAEYGEE